MSKLPVAVQLYSVRWDAEKDLRNTLEKIKQMGYDGVEFAGLYGIDPKEVRAMLDEIGLKAVSAHVGFEQLEDDCVLDCYQSLGCEYIAIPALSEQQRPGGADFEQTLTKMASIGARCKQRGMQLLYHNHEFEFVTMPDGTFGLDAIYQAVDADLLQTQLDTCWVRVANQSPVEYLETYAGRCPVVHLKDFEVEQLQQIGTPYDRKQQGTFAYRPLGRGMQDIPAILDAAKQSGAKWIVVEQDEPDGLAPMEAIAISRDYLKSIGW